MAPIFGTVRMNSQYITYMGKTINTTPTRDQVSGDLLYDLTLFVYKKDCDSCKSQSTVGGKNVEFTEIFQAVPSVRKNVKLDDYNLPGYVLTKNFLYVIVNQDGVYARSYRINDDYGLTIYKNNVGKI